MLIYELVSVSGVKPKVAVHVGANKAHEADRYERLGVERVIWIEADEQSARLGQAKLSRREPTGATHVMLQALITDEDGVATPFHVFSNKGSSSSIFRSTQRSRQEWPDVAETGEVKTYVSTRLDTLLRSQGVAPEDVGMMVFDVQGAELLCLKGAGDYLSAAIFVEVEMSREALYEGGVLAPDLDRFLTDAGLTRFTAIPWHGDVAYVRVESLSPKALERARRQAARLPT